MISIKSEREIQIMRQAGHINYLTHEELQKHLRVGITTQELDQIASKFITKQGGSSSFLNFEGYPASICTSINDEVVHGIPGPRRLKAGDIISIDIGVVYQGYHSDAARTYTIDPVQPEVRDLVINTHKCLDSGLAVVKAGARIGDIGAAISENAARFGYGVIRELVGHGVGTAIHESPDVPNYGQKNTGLKLKAGMVIAIEPMLTLGSRHIYRADDNWTIKTDDGQPAAHFEHTVLVTEAGYEILTGDG